MEPACDSIRACVAIPVYNNVRTVGDVVKRAKAFATTVLVCDDGSTDGSGAAAAAAGAELLVLPKNQGKGAALEALFAEATKRGFRYAICLDADGQHLPEDLPQVVACVQQNPGAVVVGARNLAAAGAPGSSRFGRRFSNFWIWLEAGAKVEDSQSGFRVYPLPECAQLGVRNRRYDYEVEILLRAAWAGLPIVSTPVGVLYPPDRVSHFRKFKDNVRISLLNAATCLKLLLPLPLGPRLRPLPVKPGLSLFELRRWAWLGGGDPVRRGLAALLGAFPLLTGHVGAPALWLCLAAAALTSLGALPVLLSYLAVRELSRTGLTPGLSALAAVAVGVAAGVLELVITQPPRAREHWTGRSRGGWLGHWIFYQVTRMFGPAPAYALLYPVTLYFVLTAPKERGASLAFLDRAIGPATGVRRFFRAWRHILEFSRTIVDRALIHTQGPDVFKHQSRGLEHIANAAKSGKGAVMLTAHLGNWDIAAGLLKKYVGPIPISLVTFRSEEERVQRMIENASENVKIIAVGDGELSSLEIIRALREGRLVALQGDRPIDPRVVKVPFLGQLAPFPVGPFVIAALSGAPIIATFSVQLDRCSYLFWAEPPVHVAFERGRDKQEQLEEWAAAYAAQLERIAREYPYQWFNFYDFWNPVLALPKLPPDPSATPKPQPEAT